MEVRLGELENQATRENVCLYWLLACSFRAILVELLAAGLVGVGVGPALRVWSRVQPRDMFVQAGSRGSRRGAFGLRSQLALGDGVRLATLALCHTLPLLSQFPLLCHRQEEEGPHNDDEAMSSGDSELFAKRMLLQSVGKYDPCKG